MDWYPFHTHITYAHVCVDMHMHMRTHICVPQTAGMQWQTAEIEFGRAVTLTLHANPPMPTPPDKSLGAYGERRGTYFS